jgi:hypothetical protein
VIGRAQDETRGDTGTQDSPEEMNTNPKRKKKMKTEKDGEKQRGRSVSGTRRAPSKNAV